MTAFGVREDGIGSPAHQSGKRYANEGTKVTDQQFLGEKSLGTEEIEARPT